MDLKRKGVMVWTTGPRSKRDAVALMHRVLILGDLLTFRAAKVDRVPMDAAETVARRVRLGHKLRLAESGADVSGHDAMVVHQLAQPFFC